MTYEEKKSFLKQYFVSLRKEKLLRKELEELHSKVQSISGIKLDGIPHGNSSDGNFIEKSVEKILNLEKEIKYQIYECYEKRVEVNNVILLLNDDKEQDVLRRLYIVGQKVEDIAEEMNYTPRHIFNIRRKAIQHLPL